MPNSDIDWQAVLASQRFQKLARRRRNIVLTLGILAAVYYFAIPVLIAGAPGWFRIRITDGLNLGTLFAISQYPFGGLIAWVFLRRTASLDHEAQLFTQDRQQASPVGEIA
ncbi:DUF485 domain-containing protein [Paraburkholderia sp. B3]|uniref:DUF485 domain-containing protein n=1 Tax=Paraburkholderia sp. B3 TaxID=3134791 RepID=UPI003982D5FA